MYLLYEHDKCRRMGFSISLLPSVGWGQMGSGVLLYGATDQLLISVLYNGSSTLLVYMCHFKSYRAK